jgi:2-oxo-3-hexenedioate decarboxylase
MTGLADLAEMLDRATLSATPILQLTDSVPLTLDEAYQVQHHGIARRIARGDTIVGVKLGFTSKAKAVQMGVSDVIAGHITEDLRIEDGGTLDLSRLIHPRIEPEVAFRLGAEIDPHDPLDDPLAARVEVAPALEVIDSRYRDFRFSLTDVVADNTSAAGFAVGSWCPLSSVGGIENLGVVLEVDGVVVETGSTAAILGDPRRALGAVKRMAARFGFALPAGTVVLAGAATAAVPVPSGAGSAVVTSVAGLGRVSVVVGSS